MAASMDQLIKLVNRLQDAFATVNVANPIDLPQIVVIGSYFARVQGLSFNILVDKVVERVLCLRIL
jgi:hypothetical protein